jgi:TFIIF-interacting CTD phosphatase-like protein
MDQLNASGIGGSVRNDSKPIIQIKSTTAADNNIITNKEYYLQFRPYLLHMLRALKPFFELVIFTDKSKEEAEAIINEIEKEQNFFTYIIPVNYCYYVPSESVYVKDLSIFFGNRLEGEVAMVTT